MHRRAVILGSATLIAVIGALGTAPVAVASQVHVPPSPKTMAHLMHRIKIKSPGIHPLDLIRTTPVDTSLNWSGYVALAASGQGIKFVKSYFTVPSVNCANSPIGASGGNYVYHGVGLDGWSDNTAEGVGVGAYCTSTSGPPTYFAWYQMWPGPDITFSNVSPGDAINTWVNFTGSSYNLNLRDLTTGGSISTTQTCPSGSACLNQSAEVITQSAYSNVTGGYNLPDFGMANYTNSAVTSLSGAKGTLASKSGYWSSNEIEMEDSNGTVMALPSSLGAGQGFDIAWQAAS